MHNVIALILGGGRGTRLQPLTFARSKPAVPLAGQYRLIDIPISNCINSHIERIFVLTQFLAQSLTHHIASTYRFDSFRGHGFVNLLPAEQTDFHNGNDWFQGTADAVRKTLRHTKRYKFDQFLILSGDHIYRMDYDKMLQEHRNRNADISVASIEVGRDKVDELGVMEIDTEGKIQQFVEKPTDPKLINSLEIESDFYKIRNIPPRSGQFLANMGIYVFNRDVLIDLLTKNTDEDFGKQILPKSIEEQLNVYAHLFNGYWEDIGTIRSFYEANLGFTDAVPKFNFFDENNQIFTRARFLPPVKVNKASIEQSVIGGGSIVQGASIVHSVVGLRSIIDQDTIIKDSILMGADSYENFDDREQNIRLGRPHIGIAENCQIKRAIIDKDARIGRGVKLIGGNAPDQSGSFWTLRDSILIIHKDAIVPDGTELIFNTSKIHVHSEI